MLKFVSRTSKNKIPGLIVNSEKLEKQKTRKGGRGEVGKQNKSQVETSFCVINALVKFDLDISCTDDKSDFKKVNLPEYIIMYLTVTGSLSSSIFFPSEYSAVYNNHF